MPKTKKNAKTATVTPVAIDAKATAQAALAKAQEDAKALGILPEKRKRESASRGWDGRAYVVAAMHYAVYGTAARRDEIRRPLRPDALIPDLVNALPRLRDRGVLRQESRGAGGHVFVPLGLSETEWKPSEADVTEGIAAFAAAHSDVTASKWKWNPETGFFVPVSRARR